MSHGPLLAICGPIPLNLERKGFRLNTVKKIFALLNFVTWVVACTGGQDPQVTYRGIEAKAAIELLSQKSSEAQFANIIDQIAHNRRQGFDWHSFWVTLNERGLLKQFSKKHQIQIVELGRLDCSYEAHNAFVAALLDLPEYDDVILSAERFCDQGLSTENFTSLFERLSSKAVRGRDPVSSRHLSFLISELKVDPGLLRASMDHFSEREWVSVALQWLQYADSAVIRRFITTQRNLYGSSQMLESLSVATFQSSTEIAEIFQYLGLTRGLDLMIGAIGNNPDALNGPEDQWRRQINSLIQMFDSKEMEAQLNREQLLLEDYRSFERFVTFLSLSEGKITGALLMSFLSDVTAVFEAKVTSAEDALFLTRSFPENPLLSSVLIRKFHQQVGEEYFEATLRNVTEQTSGLQKLLQLRLAIYLAESDEVGHLLTQDYCQMLEDLGQSTKRIEPNELSPDFTLFAGCVEFDNLQPPNGSLTRQGDFQFSPYNLLVTNGYSIFFRTNSFQGSMIDTSNTWIHPELPEEQTPEVDHAVAVPVPLGLRLSLADGALEAGTHYLLFHYTWRFAKDGRPSEVMPKQGLFGGDIVVQTEREDDYLAPLLISLGGAGQKGAPPRRGGSASVSKISWQKFSSLLALSNPQNLEQTETRIFQPQPSLKVLEKLIENAERNETGGIRLVYLNQLWWEALSADQQAKLQMICGSPLIDEACASQLATEAAHQLVADLTQAKASGASENSTLSRLTGVNFEEPQGALGPLNPDGPMGESGTLTWEVRSE